MVTGCVTEQRLNVDVHGCQVRLPANQNRVSTHMALSRWRHLYITWSIIDALPLGWQYGKLTSILQPAAIKKTPVALDAFTICAIWITFTGGRRSVGEGDNVCELSWMHPTNKAGNTMSSVSARRFQRHFVNVDVRCSSFHKKNTKKLAQIWTFDAVGMFSVIELSHQAVFAKSSVGSEMKRLETQSVIKIIVNCSALQRNTSTTDLTGTSCSENSRFRIFQ